jgi:hypothetical protein
MWQTVLKGSYPENRICHPAKQLLAPQHTGFFMVGK